MIRRRTHSWEVRVYAGLDAATGRKRWISRSVPAKSGQTRPPREARDLEARLLLEVRDGQHATARVTCRALFAHWLADVAGELSPWTVQGYQGIVDRYLNPAIGDWPLEKVTPASLDRLYRQLAAKGGQGGRPMSPRTVAHVHAVVRRAFADAERYGWVAKNPAVLARPPRLEARQVSTPAPADVDRLLATCDDDDLALFVLLAATTGARRGELCGLRWTDVDFTTSRVTIARSIADPAGQVIVKTPKTGRVRVVAIGPGVAAALDARHARAKATAKACKVRFATDGYVLSDDARSADPWRPETVSKRFARLADRAEVDCTLHSLRHAHVTELLGAGLPVRDVADRVGHASARMTLDVYGHAMPATDRRAAELTDRPGPSPATRKP